MTLKKKILAALLAAIVIAVYWQSTTHDFVDYDDRGYVTENNHVKEGVTYQNVIWAFTTLSLSNWHPVTWLSYMLDHQMYGSKPFGFHLTNILFHTANTLLLFYLLYYATGSYWRSIFVAALFGVHPLHVESVAWVAERKDLLSAFFMFLTLILYTSYARRPRPSAYVLALAAYILGLMSKPMLVTLPFVMLLWDYWPLGRLTSSAGQKEHPHGGDRGSSPSPVLRLLLE
jgi:hypothetical protein